MACLVGPDTSGLNPVDHSFSDSVDFSAGYTERFNYSIPEFRAWIVRDLRVKLTWLTKVGNWSPSMGIILPLGGFDIAQYGINMRMTTGGDNGVYVPGDVVEYTVPTLLLFGGDFSDIIYSTDHAGAGTGTARAEMSWTATEFDVNPSWFADWRNYGPIAGPGSAYNTLAMHSSWSPAGGNKAVVNSVFLMIQDYNSAQALANGNPMRAQVRIVTAANGTLTKEVSLAPGVAAKEVSLSEAGPDYELDGTAGDSVQIWFQDPTTDNAGGIGLYTAQPNVTEYTPPYGDCAAAPGGCFSDSAYVPAVLGPSVLDLNRTGLPKTSAPGVGAAKTSYEAPKAGFAMNNSPQKGNANRDT